MLAWGRKIRRELPCPHLQLSLLQVVPDPHACPRLGEVLAEGRLLGCRSGGRGRRAVVLVSGPAAKWGGG